MKKFIIFGVVIIILILFGYSRRASPKLITVALVIQNQSSERGQAILTEVDGQIKVELKLASKAGDSQSVSINRGSCDAISEVIYLLNPVINGLSVTTITASFLALEANLPLSISVNNACGNLVLE